MIERIRDGSETERDFRDSDVFLAEVIEDISRRIDAGENLDVELYKREYPELAGQLSQLLPALTVLEDLGRSTAGGTRGSPGVAPYEDGPAGRVLGDYRILDEIGRGGMGIVYEAEQVSLGRRVALKVLPFAAVLDQKQIQRFKNEAHAAAQLHHTNIVPVFGVGSERGVHYYAMQLIEGQSLAQAVKELRALEGLGVDTKDKRDAPAGEGPGTGTDAISHLSRILASGTFAPPAARHDAGIAGGIASQADTTSAPKDSTPTPLGALSSGKTASTRSTSYVRTIAHLGRQAAEALEHAHDVGIVHRDVKPANFLIDVKGNLWITDFGLARCRSDASLTMSGDLVGTLRYMSPEQALAKRVSVDQRTDIYSLGVTLYELLTLEPAFSGRDREELLRKIAFEEPCLPRRLNKGIPPDLETIVLKAMTKDPQARYGTAKEVGDDLTRFLEDRPIVARRPTMVQRAAKWSRRHRKLVASVLTITVLGAISAWLAYAHVRARDEALYQQYVHEASLELGGLDLVWTSRARGMWDGVGPAYAAIADHVTGALDTVNLGRTDHPIGEAMDRLVAAVELAPDRPDAHYHLAKAFLHADEPARALSQIGRALVSSPDFLPARVLRANLLERLGRVTEAASERERAREHSIPGHWTETWLRGQEAMLAGDFEQTVADLEKLIDENAEDSYIGYLLEIYVGLGSAHLAARDYDRAKEAFSRAAGLWWPQSALPVIWEGITDFFGRREDLAVSRRAIATFSALWSWRRSADSSIASSDSGGSGKRTRWRRCCDTRSSAPVQTRWPASSTRRESTTRP